MNFLPELLTVATIHLLAVMSPGPDFAMVTRNSFLYSKRSGIFTSIGLGLGILVHVIYSLVGLGLIISQSIILFNFIKIAGALYLIYIGYQSIKHSGKTSLEELENSEEKKENLSDLESLRLGFITNVTNPKATIFFLSVFTQVISPETPFFVKTIYGLEMSLVTFLWFFLVASLFGVPIVRQKFSQYKDKIEKVFGALLIALGLKIAIDK